MKDHLNCKLSLGKWAFFLEHTVLVLDDAVEDRSGNYGLFVFGQRKTPLAEITNGARCLVEG